MPRPDKPKQKAPHGFVVEALAPLNPEVRRMFSGFAIYVGDLLICMLRESPKSPRDNGVWLVLSESIDPGDPGLKRELPSLRRIELLENKIGHWLLIPNDSPGFEAARGANLPARADLATVVHDGEVYWTPAMRLPSMERLRVSRVRSEWKSLSFTDPNQPS